MQIRPDSGTPSGPNRNLPESEASNAERTRHVRRCINVTYPARPVLTALRPICVGKTKPASRRLHVP